MNLEFLNKVIRYKYDSTTFLAISPMGCWSIRSIDGNILDYGSSLSQLYRSLGVENPEQTFENHQRPARSASWQI